jgi:hypothetical protein
MILLLHVTPNKDFPSSYSLKIYYIFPPQTQGQAFQFRKNGLIVEGLGQCFLASEKF